MVRPLTGVLLRLLTSLRNPKGKLKGGSIDLALGLEGTDAIAVYNERTNHDVRSPRTVIRRRKIQRSSGLRLAHSSRGEVSAPPLRVGPFSLQSYALLPYSAP